MNFQWALSAVGTFGFCPDITEFLLVSKFELKDQKVSITNQIGKK